VVSETDLVELRSRLLYDGRPWARASTPEASVRLVCGVGVYAPNAAFGFDGRTRRDFLSLPVVLLQYGLAGGLAIRIGAEEAIAGPGDLSVLGVPGENGMRLAPGRGSVHAYLAIYHGYVTPRLLARIGAGVVGPLAPEAKLTGLLTERLALARDSVEPDPRAEEADVFRLLLEIEAWLERRPVEDQARRWRGAVAEVVAASGPRRATIDEMAAACGVGPAHFIRRFRALTGETPASYALGLRLSRAMQQLIETSAPLKTVAFEAGFADAQSFSHTFRRRLGVTPGAFRRRHAWSS
jgi:AraC-like DNA-binding protein